MDKVQNLGYDLCFRFLLRKISPVTSETLEWKRGLNLLGMNFESNEPYPKEDDQKLVEKTVWGLVVILSPFVGWGRMVRISAYWMSVFARIALGRCSCSWLVSLYPTLVPHINCYRDLGSSICMNLAQSDLAFVKLTTQFSLI